MKLIIIVFLIALVMFPAFIIIRGASACGLMGQGMSHRASAVERLMDQPAEVDADSPF